MVTDFPDRPIVVSGLGGVLEWLGNAPILRPTTYMDTARGVDITTARLDLTSQNVSLLAMRPSAEGPPLMEGILFQYSRRTTISYRHLNRQIDGVWANEYLAASPANMYGWESEWSRGIAGRFLVGSLNAPNLWRIVAMDADHLGRRIFVIRREENRESENSPNAERENGAYSLRQVRLANDDSLEACPPQFDLFLSHASEDKATIARPLYEALRARGVTVWFDQAVLKLGDSLSGKIEEGLARCRRGVVVISPSFLAKRWPQKELAGLVAREIADGKKVILPIWHDIDAVALAQQSPTLADKVAGRSSDGIDALVAMILDVLQ